MKRLIVLALLLVACQPVAKLAPSARQPLATTRPFAAKQAQLNTPFPTQTPRSIWATRALTPTPTLTSPPPTATLVPTLPQMIFVTQIPETSVPTWTPPPPNPASLLPQHFMLKWPVRVATFNRAYPYGGTDDSHLQVHHGDDMVNALGTPIHAAGDGTVVYAGDDLTTLFGPANDYYGHLVIIQHNFLSPEGLPVFTLYGHMDQFGVVSGQPVHQGDVIGTVGETGIALGPHVHVEIRVGNPFDFGATRNPELWLQPPPNSGVLVGRVVDAVGQPVYNVAMTVQSSSATRAAYSYGDNSVNSDPALGENYTLGNLPPDYYAVSVTLNDVQRFSGTVYVYPNQLNWLTVQLSP